MLEQMGKAAREASWHSSAINRTKKSGTVSHADLLEQQEACILA